MVVRGIGNVITTVGVVACEAVYFVSKTAVSGYTVRAGSQRVTVLVIVFVGLVKTVLVVLSPLHTIS